MFTGNELVLLIMALALLTAVFVASLAAICFCRSWRKSADKNKTTIAAAAAAQGDKNEPTTAAVPVSDKMLTHLVS